MLDLQPNSPTRLPIGIACRTFIAASLTLTAVTALGFTPPDWLQPTVVGVLLSTLFLLGLAAGRVRQGSLLFACLALADSLLCKSALQVLTSLTQAECLLIVICCLGFGWLTVHLDYSVIKSNELDQAIRQRQWTLWDMGLLTVWVACMCQACPRLESPANLLVEVGFVIVGVAVSGWMAVRWVHDDNWTLIKLMAMAGSLGIGLGFVYVLRPPQTSILQLASWMMTGPMAVVASHCVTVLVALTLIRIDRGSLVKHVKSPEEIQAEPQPFKLRVHSGR